MGVCYNFVCHDCKINQGMDTHPEYWLPELAREHKNHNFDVWNDTLFDDYDINPKYKKIDSNYNKIPWRQRLASILPYECMDSKRLIFAMNCERAHNPKRNAGEYV